MADQHQGQYPLSQPSLGDRQIEKHLVGRGRGRRLGQAPARWKVGNGGGGEVWLHRGTGRRRLAVHACFRLVGRGIASPASAWRKRASWTTSTWPLRCYLALNQARFPSPCFCKPSRCGCRGARYRTRCYSASDSSGPEFAWSSRRPRRRGGGLDTTVAQRGDGIGPLIVAHEQNHVRRPADRRGPNRRRTRASPRRSCRA
jgi:hypothetical protein